MPSATLTARTSNAKLTSDPRRRPVSVTRASQSSCPASCPALGVWCYAEHGHAGLHARRLEPAAPLDVATQEAAAIRASWPRDGRPLRLHEVGDATTAECAELLAGAVADAQAEGAGPAWSYTHAWRDVPRAAWGHVSVLASCETADDVREAQSRGYPAARVVAEFESPRRDSRGIPCPAQTGAAPDCASCRLCMRADRLAAPILFAAHGSGARELREALAAAD